VYEKEDSHWLAGVLKGVVLGSGPDLVVLVGGGPDSSFVAGWRISLLAGR